MKCEERRVGDDVGRVEGSSLISTVENKATGTTINLMTVFYVIDALQNTTWGYLKGVNFCNLNFLLSFIQLMAGSLLVFVPSS